MPVPFNVQVEHLGCEIFLILGDAVIWGILGFTEPLEWMPDVEKSFQDDSFQEVSPNKNLVLLSAGKLVLSCGKL